MGAKVLSARLARDATGSSSQIFTNGTPTRHEWRAYGVFRGSFADLLSAPAISRALADTCFKGPGP